MPSVSIGGAKNWINSEVLHSSFTNNSLSFGHDGINSYTLCIKFTVSGLGERYIGDKLNISFYVYGTDTNIGYAVSTSSSDSEYIDARGSIYSNYGYGTANLTGNTTENTIEFDASNYTNGTYYLYLWPESDGCGCPQWYSSSGAPASGSISTIYRYQVTFDVGIGSGSVPATIYSIAGNYVSVGSVKPTPPSNSTTSSNQFTITAYNDNAVVGSMIAYKDHYTSYQFSHWYGNDITCDSNSGFYMPDNDVVLTAQYDSKLNISYRNNTIGDLKDVIADQSKDYDEKEITLLLDASTNGGITEIDHLTTDVSGKYVFAGWNILNNQNTGLEDTSVVK